MPNSVGWRAIWAFVAPDVNTSVEHDVWSIRPPGIHFHASAIESLSGPIRFEEQMDHYRGPATQRAVSSALACQPDHVVMWMSSATLWRGRESASAFRAQFAAWAGGRPVTLASEAVVAGVQAFGASRISLISPYMPESEVHIHRYFMDHGIEIRRLTSLAVQEGHGIVNVPTATLVDELKKLASSDVQALVQIGAGMSMLKLGAEAESWLGKPVVTINAATLWHVMRTSGFNDQFKGFGSLLSEH